MAAYVDARLGLEDSEDYRDARNLRSDKEIVLRSFNQDPIPPKYMYFDLSIRLADAFFENVLAHPFIVLKRQCQVHQNSHSYHLLPFTLIPVLFKLQSRQGFGTLWKGIGSVFIVKGLLILSEDVLSKIMHWPKEITYLHSIQNIFQHLFLKFVAAAITTPFYSACLIETVQSDVASEKPGVFDCIAEGLGRLIPHKHPPTSRILPVWMLAAPTAAHGVLHYLIFSMSRHVAITLWRCRESSIMVTECKEDTIASGYAELATFIGHLTADIFLYPVETVLNRLHVQGTRTIIDNLDTGCEVTPVITKYEGPIECLQTIVDEEGASGLFKGFGALVLQYLLHAAVITVIKFVSNECLKRNRRHNYRR